MKSRGSAAAPTPGERELLDRIRSRLPPPPSSVVVGIGDDAAVARPERGSLQAFTTDALVEGVHFERCFSSLADIGFKAIAVNVSDLAAMGASPSLALLSLMLPEGVAAGEIDELLDGVIEMAGQTRIAVAGGNITRSPGPLIVDVALVGHVRPRRILTRGGGRPGDALYVTGTIGAAAAGLDWLREQVRLKPDGADGDMAECIRRHRRPEPRLRAGTLLGRTRTASACIDLSDGLADGVIQIAESSGTGARVNAEALPVHSGARAWFAARGRDPVDDAIRGGDDYELLFAVPAKSAGGRLRAVVRAARGVTFTRIGDLTKDPAVVLVRDGRDNQLPRGFVHF